MAEFEPLIQRLKKQRFGITGMVAPWLQSLVERRRNLGLASDGHASQGDLPGGFRLQAAGQAMRVLRRENLGSLQPENALVFSRAVTSKVSQLPDLLHINPSVERDASAWSEVDRTLPASSPPGGPTGPEDPGMLRQGSVIPRMSMFPQPGQSLESFKEQAANLPMRPRQAERNPEKPRVQPGQRLFTRVQEVSSSPRGKTEAAGDADGGGDTSQASSAAPTSGSVQREPAEPETRGLEPSARREGPQAVVRNVTTSLPREPQPVRSADASATSGARPSAVQDDKPQQPENVLRKAVPAARTVQAKPASPRATAIPTKSRGQSSPAPSPAPELPVQPHAPALPAQELSTGGAQVAADLSFQEPRREEGQTQSEQPGREPAAPEGTVRSEETGTVPLAGPLARRSQPVKAAGQEKSEPLPRALPTNQRADATSQPKQETKMVSFPRTAGKSSAVTRPSAPSVQRQPERGFTGLPGQQQRTAPTQPGPYADIINRETTPSAERNRLPLANFATPPAEGEPREPVLRAVPTHLPVPAAAPAATPPGQLPQPGARQAPAAGEVDLTVHRAARPGPAAAGTPTAAAQMQELSAPRAEPGSTQKRQMQLHPDEPLKLDPQLAQTMERMAQQPAAQRPKKETAIRTRGNTVQRSPIDDARKQISSSNGKQSTSPTEQAMPAELDLDSLAEEVLPIVKRLLQIELERSSGNVY